MSGTESRVTDEEILNVLRQADDEEMTNSEIAEHLPIGSTQVNNRMSPLRENGRVLRRKTGGPYLWRLSPHEPSVVIPPDYKRVALWSGHLKLFASEAIPIAKYTTLAGLGLLLIALTAAVGSFEIPFLSVDEALATGYVLASAGILVWVLISTLKLFGVVLPKAINWLTRSSTVTIQAEES